MDRKGVVGFLAGGIAILLMLWALLFLSGCGGAPVEVEKEIDTAETPPKSEAPEWAREFGAALREARAEAKPVLVYFTGSDWCVPCADWSRRILDSEEFLEFAAERLILVEVDFPMRVEQTMETVHQNHALKSRFEIEVFPTLVLTDPEGEEIDRMAGVMPERPRDFIHWLEETRKEGM